MAAWYLLAGDREAAVEQLEQALAEAKKFEAYEDSARYPDGCLLFKGYEVTPHSHWSRSALADMQDYLRQERYASLCNDSRFVAILDTLKSHTGENQ